MALRRHAQRPETGDFLFWPNHLNMIHLQIYYFGRTEYCLKREYQLAPFSSENHKSPPKILKEHGVPLKSHVFYLKTNLGILLY